MDTKQQLKQLRDAVLAERKAEIERVQADASRAMSAVVSKFQKKLDAFDVLIADEIDINNERSVLPNTTDTPRNILAKNIMEAVRESIPENSFQKFSSKTLISYIRQKYPDMAKRAADLSNPLWRLRKAGEIELVKKGEGRKPSMYRRTVQIIGPIAPQSTKQP